MIIVDMHVLTHFCRHSITRAFCIAFLMTFFSMFDVPVFWPILLFYWIVLFVLTMRRQISHMIKYKYIPFSIGKQVGFLFMLLLNGLISAIKKNVTRATITHGLMI